MHELAHHERAPKQRKAPEGQCGRATTALIEKQTAITPQKGVDSFTNSGLKVSGGEGVRAMPAYPAEHQALSAT